MDLLRNSTRNKVNERRVTRLQFTIPVILLTVFLLWALGSRVPRIAPAWAASEGSSEKASPEFGQNKSQTTVPLVSTSNPQLDVAASGTFTVAMNSDAVGLDPSMLGDSNSWLVTSQIYETLVDYEAGGTIPTPGLAESWTVSSDGLTWTFNLRPGVKFHDGTDLDAAAVLYNFQRWWDPANPYHTGTFDYFTYLFGGFKGDSQCIITDITSTSTSQLQISLKQPINSLPSRLAIPPFAIASPNAIQSGTLVTTPVGSGPFKFVTWTPGDRIRLDANPNYWGNKPRLDSLTFQVITTDSARFAALQTNQAQSVGDLPSSYLSAAAADPNLRALHRPAAIATGYLGINRTHTPLDNLQVRQAIAHAINKQRLIDTYYGLGSQVAKEFLPPSLWGYDPSIVDYGYDPALARSLLAQAGYSSGFTTTLAYRAVPRSYLPDPANTVTAIKADLQAVGIDATVIEYESGTFLTKVYSGELDLYLLGWGGDYPHPDNFFSPVLCDKYRAFGSKDDVLCNQLQAVQTEPSFDAQLAIYQSASRRVHDTLPLVPLAHPQSFLIERWNVAGLTPSPISLEAFKDTFYSNAWVCTSTTGYTATIVSGNGLTTTIQLPAGEVNTTTLFLYTPVLTTSSSPSSTFDFAGHAFSLEAFQNNAQVPLTFTNPITIVIEYSNADVANIDESTLTLYYWKVTRWANDGITIIDRDAIHNRLTATLGHLSDFALFGQISYKIYLPLVVR